MVLGLIDFLLGGKKKTQVQKNAQVTTPSNAVGGNAQNDAANGQDNPAGNATVNNMNSESPVSGDSNTGTSQGGKKSISDVIANIHKEIKDTNDTVGNIATEIKEIQNSINALEKKTDELDKNKNEVNDRLTDIDENMNKFLSLYELVNNQYNPFVENGGAPRPKEIVVSSGGGEGMVQSNMTDAGNGNSEKIVSELASASSLGNSGGMASSSAFGSGPALADSKNDLKDSLLELDTLDIEEAAADAVPLTRLKSNTNSLVIILSWLEYLVKRIGVEETKNALRYYTETLKWITPEVFFELDKFLRGMADSDVESRVKSLGVRDHIVSLYFISKLNEKVLDSKLTKAVLQIIKE